MKSFDEIKVGDSVKILFEGLYGKGFPYREIGTVKARYIRFGAVTVTVIVKSHMYSFSTPSSLEIVDRQLMLFPVK